MSNSYRDILPQKSDKVKPDNENSTLDKTLEKWENKKTLALRMSERLYDAGMIRRSLLMKQCGTEIVMTRCADCGALHVTRTNLCRDKLCPVCTWRLSLKRFINMRSVMSTIWNEHQDAEFAFVTLTVKNCKIYNLSNHLLEMSKAWNRLISRKKIKSMVDGTARAVEITYNHETHEAHPHFHIIVLCLKGNAKEVGDYLIHEWCDTVKAKTAKEAQDCKPILLNIEDRKADRENGIMSAVLETFKYTQKTSDLFCMTLQELREYAIQVSNKRMLSFSGLFKIYARLIDSERDAPNDTDADFQEAKKCNDCGSDKLEKLLYKWSFADCKYVPNEI